MAEARLLMASFTGHDLTCIRGDRMVFSGVDFAVESGGALVLTGANGSGKSSLLRLMAGLGQAAEGRIAWDGVGIDDSDEDHGSRLAYLGHADAVKPHLTVAENIEFWVTLRLGGTAARDAVVAALKVLAIDHLADVPGRYLSAGQRRRVNLARVIAVGPRLWLLDEPTTALDRDTIARLEAAMADARAGGAMVVLSTHSNMALGDAKTLELGA